MIPPLANVKSRRGARGKRGKLRRGPARRGLPGKLLLRKLLRRLLLRLLLRPMALRRLRPPRPRNRLRRVKLPLPLRLPLRSIRFLSGRANPGILLSRGRRRFLTGGSRLPTVLRLVVATLVLVLVVAVPVARATRAVVVALTVMLHLNLLVLSRLPPRPLLTRRAGLLSRAKAAVGRATARLLPERV